MKGKQSSTQTNYKRIQVLETPQKNTNYSINNNPFREGSQKYSEKGKRRKQGRNALVSRYRQGYASFDSSAPEKRGRGRITASCAALYFGVKKQKELLKKT